MELLTGWIIYSRKFEMRKWAFVFREKYENLFRKMWEKHVKEQTNENDDYKVEWKGREWELSESRENMAVPRAAFQMFIHFPAKALIIHFIYFVQRLFWSTQRNIHTIQNWSTNHTRLITCYNIVVVYVVHSTSMLHNEYLNNSRIFLARLPIGNGRCRSIGARRYRNSR